MPKANSNIGENGLFKKAINSLNMKPSMRRGKEAVVADMEKAVKSNNIRARKYTRDAKRIMEEGGDGVKELGKIATLEQKNEVLQGKLGKISKGGFKAADTLDQAKMIGSGIADYYNPLSDASVATKALRYGATAGAVGAASVGGRYMSGGTLTHDSEGNKDIAGVPFI